MIEIHLRHWILFIRVPQTFPGKKIWGALPLFSGGHSGVTQNGPKMADYAIFSGSQATHYLIKI